MKIAVCMDYKFPVGNFKKEGIAVYLLNLLEHCLVIADVKVEVYCYSFNKDEMVSVFSDLSKKYPNKISFCIPQNNNISILTKMKLKISLIKYKIKNKFLPKDKYLLKIKRLENALQGEYSSTNYLDEVQKLKTLAEEAKADVVLIPHPELEMGRYFQCRKVFILHDIYTFIPQNKERYYEICPIDEINQKMAENLKEYAKLNTIFVSSTKYTVETQTLKYIEGCQPEQTRVIRYLPMLKEFSTDNILSEEDFREKYNITAQYYIPYASQNRPNKNLILLLKALNRLKAENFSIQLVTTGSIDVIPSTKKYVKENRLNDMIVETGILQENDLYALYRYGSVVVVPTMIEGFGMSGQCLEALKFGSLPVIHAKSLGMEESLKSVGLSWETADLNWVELDDDFELAEKIKQVLHNPQPHIEKQKHILSAYTQITWDDVAAEYMKIFTNQ